jgi:hypothetical protein
LALLLVLAAVAGELRAQDTGSAGRPVVVRVEKKGGGFQLTRGGQPYFIRGAGGGGRKALLRQVGGNSFRTWGADNLDAELDEAQKLGLSVTVGIWLGHKEHGFRYDDPAQVGVQYAAARAVILRYRNHPALLAWGLGNEMEGYGQGDAPNVWNAVEDIAALAKRLDPNHPAMTVIAEIGGKKVPSLHKYCPDVDIVGINSYGGGPSIPERYRAAGGTKPYVITEFGPPGSWESPKTSWGAPLELSSTEKAVRYRKTYQSAVANQPLCLGSYAFTWGNKQEATATWFGMLLPDGSRLAAVDTMQELWTGKPPANRVPELRSLRLDGPDKVPPGARVEARLEAKGPEGDPLTVRWVLQQDSVAGNAAGAEEAAPQEFPDAIVRGDVRGTTVRMPAYGGAYRLFAYVRDNHGGAAVANVPLFVEGGAAPPPTKARKARLPLVVYGGSGEAPYTPSGWMGNRGAIRMNPDCRERPHSGKTCLKVTYTVAGDWGGVVWQSPANDWGDRPGGWDLTGAKKLTFWARGAAGGETVTFEMGLYKKNKKFFDTGSGKLERLVLTPEWKPYAIDLTGQDLTRIKSGFAWVVAGSGKEITFYLDDVQYE